jgi:hypothetical protein
MDKTHRGTIKLDRLPVEFSQLQRYFGETNGSRNLKSRMQKQAEFLRIS